MEKYWEKLFTDLRYNVYLLNGSLEYLNLIGISGQIFPFGYSKVKVF